MPTGIEWTDETWNPVAGCSLVSPGCTNCYAMKQAARIERMHAACGRSTHYDGLTQKTKAGPVWTGKVAIAWHNLDVPLRWTRPKRIFVNSMSDLFHEGLPADEIATIYGTAVASVHLRGHVLQILTKRSARMRQLLADEEWWEIVNDVADSHVMERVDPLDRRKDDARATLHDYGPDKPPPGIWLGVSTEDQARADERIPDLLATPADKRFISAEPLLGRITLSSLCHKLDWVIVGGESGAGARPMHPDWARELRDACAAAQIPFFFKQWGEWLGCTMDDPSDGSGWVIYPDDESIDLGAGRFKTMTAHGKDFFRYGKKRAGATLDGVEHRAMP